MLLCRNVWQKLAPLTHRGAAAALLRNASVRPMSSSSVPGSSGEALPYYLLVAVTLTGGGIYAYRTLRRDKARFHERHEYINEQLKPAFEEYETKSDKAEASAVSETIEEAVEAAIEETAAEEVTEQEAAPSATLEQEQAAAEDEAAPAPTEQEQEPAPSTEAASEQESEEAVGSEQATTSS
ncbi:protein MGARP isoform X2 [Bufo bufo]|uniref:protein MGARP isoform X2 n=1 Tax=Bufo bufo TaxID=8384 RepID=UPI001ABE5BD5|nr:protein MGARP isoform X2 [Bufo bufo]